MFLVNVYPEKYNLIAIWTRLHLWSLLVIFCISMTTAQVQGKPERIRNLYSDHSQIPVSSGPYGKGYNENLLSTKQYNLNYNKMQPTNKRLVQGYRIRAQSSEPYLSGYSIESQSKNQYGPHYNRILQSNNQYRQNYNRSPQSNEHSELAHNNNLQVNDQYGSDYYTKSQTNGQYDVSDHNKRFQPTIQYGSKGSSKNPYFEGQDGSRNSFKSPTSTSLSHFSKDNNRPLNDRGQQLYQKVDTPNKQHIKEVHLEHSAVPKQSIKDLHDKPHRFSSDMMQYQTLPSTFPRFQDDQQETSVYTKPYQLSSASDYDEGMLDGDFSKIVNEIPKYVAPPDQSMQSSNPNPQSSIHSTLKYHQSLPLQAIYAEQQKSHTILKPQEDPQSFAQSIEIPERPVSVPLNVQSPKYEVGFVPLSGQNVPKSESAVISQNSPKFKSTLLSETSLKSQFSGVSNSKSFNIDCGSSSKTGWCDVGQHYPKSEVNYVIQKCLDTIRRMYVQFPAKLETIGDNEPFGYFYNFSGNGSDQRQWNSFPSRMVALCDSKQKLVYPSYAKDSTGKWNLIVQTDEFPQRIPVELCRSQDEPCGNIAACGLSSRCVQKYAYQLLLSIDHEKPEKCPTMKLYKFHSACVCFAQRVKLNG